MLQVEAQLTRVRKDEGVRGEVVAFTVDFDVTKGHVGWEVGPTTPVDVHTIPPNIFALNGLQVKALRASDATVAVELWTRRGATTRGHVPDLEREGGEFAKLDLLDLHCGHVLSIQFRFRNAVSWCVQED